MEPIVLKPPEILPQAEPPALLPRAPFPHDAALSAHPPHRDCADQAREVPISLFPADVVLDRTPRTNGEPDEPIELLGPAPARGVLSQIGTAIATACSYLFGAISLIGGLALLASYPIVQFLSLGYLLDAAGRIGRTGRLRDSFPGVRFASRVGGAVLGVWLVVLPWRFATLLLADARLIDAESRATWLLDRIVLVLAVATPLHVLLAVSRGGRLRYFFWPFNFVWFVRRLWRGGYSRETWESVRAMWRRLRLWQYFWLGLRGYVLAGLWLIVPTSLYAVGRSDARGLFALLGGLLVAAVVLYVPFLQVQFAAQNQWRAMFAVGEVRERFRRAPIAFLIAFVFTLLLALPLYLLKIEVVPRDAVWLPALVFIVTILPLKVLTGWAYGRAGRRERRAYLITRIGCRLLMIPVALFYAAIVFFTQYIGWHGVQSLYEHHAFLLPVPF